MSRNSWYKSDEYVKKRNIMKMKLWKKVMKQFIEEKSDEHKVAVHVKKMFFSEKEIQQTSCAITCIECKKRLFLSKFNNHLVL